MDGINKTQYFQGNRIPYPFDIIINFVISRPLLSYLLHVNLVMHYKRLLLFLHQSVKRMHSLILPYIAEKTRLPQSTKT